MNATRRAFLSAPFFLAVGRAAPAQEIANAVKATYLVKFTGFVEWPPTAFAGPSSPLMLCVAGDRPLGGLLDRAAAGVSLGQHPIEIRRLGAVGRNSGCHMLFATGGAVGSALAAARGEPVLTVTDVPPGAPSRGIINFVVQNNRVRFEIDGPAAAASGLRISSQLMALAVNTR